MGKVFITDEIDDRFTGKVTQTGAQHVLMNHNSYYHLTGAVSGGALTPIISAVPCWLHSVIINRAPLTASDLLLVDMATTGACATSIGVVADLIGVSEVSAGRRIAKINCPLEAVTLNAAACASGVTQAVQSLYPKTLLYDLYCSNGLIALLSAGNLDATIVYKT